MPFKMTPEGKRVPIKLAPKQVINAIRTEKVRFIDLHFTDLPGRLQHTTIPSHLVDLELFERGTPKLDGSSIKGFAEIHESDLVLIPDPSTFAIIPWIPKNLKTARMLCDVHWGYGGGRLSRDPRSIAQQAEKMINDKGFNLSYWGAEIEFFVFDKVTWDVMSPHQGMSYRIESREAPWSPSGLTPPIRFKEGYFPAPPQDTLAGYRSECVRVLEDCFGIACDAHHHEVATGGQCEIDLLRDTLTNQADGVITCKFVAKSLAHQGGTIATMMPKPIFGDNASGMHVHASLWKDGKNVFYDPADKYAELSQLGRYFVGGLIDHGRSLSAIVAPTTNSYRRLVPGYEAPVYLAWSRRNRSAAVRIPVYHKGAKAAGAKRIEYRPPDPSANPYLCFAAMLAAGLEGVKKKTDIGDPVDEDIYKLSPERRRQLGIKELPGSLEEAVAALKSDHEYLKMVFPQDVIDRIIESGLKEAKEVSMRPHPYEFHQYFDV